jgi:hypothetical protein
MNVRRIISLVLVCLYLLPPLGCFASPQTTLSQNEIKNESRFGIASLKEPATHGNSTDQQCTDDSDNDLDFDSDFEVMMFSPANSMITYLPSITQLSALEPLQRFPQVYPTITTPPPS